MTPALALLLLLAATPGDATPRLLHGGPAAQRAWLAAIAGALWICWDDRSGHGTPDPGCWQRVDLPPGAVDPRELRALFLDAATLVVRGGDGEALQLVRGDPTLQVADPGLLGVEPRQVMTRIACGPNGHVPIYTRGRWAWIAAPCPVGAGQCVAPAALPRLRRPAAFALFFTIQVEARERHKLGEASEAIASSSVVAKVGLAFDPARWIGRHLAWNELQTARRPRLRELPPARGSGPVAAREREALAAILCGGPVQ